MGKMTMCLLGSLLSKSCYRLPTGLTERRFNVERSRIGVLAPRKRLRQRSSATAGVPAPHKQTNERQGDAFLRRDTGLFCFYNDCAVRCRRKLATEFRAEPV